jgi:hypothetical protein
MNKHLPTVLSSMNFAQKSFRDHLF